MHHVTVDRILVKLAIILLITLIFFPLSIQASEIVLGWDPPDDSSVTGYNVYYGETGTSFKNSPRMTNSSYDQTTAVISDLTEGVSYQFTVTSVNAAGAESDFSQEISYTVPPADPDQCPADPDKTDPGQCGCGVADTDTDGDGTVDCIDQCPLDPVKSIPGLCGCNVSEIDTDSDGSADCVDTDDDSDGIPDQWEVQYGLDPLIDDSDGDPDGDGKSNMQEYRAGTDPAQSNKKGRHAAPLLLSPADSAINIERDVVLETGYAEADGTVKGTHKATEWQISTTTDFSELVFAIKDKKNLTQLPVPDLTLSKNTLYYWRARYYDNEDAESDWSEANTLTTGSWAGDDNQNGIPDESEVEVLTDLDQNGIADNAQSDMKCVNVKNENTQIGIKCPESEGAIECLESVDGLLIPDEAGKPEILPIGLLNFKVNVDQPGQTISVTVFLSDPAPENTGWYKYDTVTGWQDYSSHATFSQDRKSVDVELKDGGFGDADGVENGVILDPSGLGIAAAADDGVKTGGGGGGGCFIGSLY